MNCRKQIILLKQELHQIGNLVLCYAVKGIGTIVVLDTDCQSDEIPGMHLLYNGGHNLTLIYFPYLAGKSRDVLGHR